MQVLEVDALKRDLLVGKHASLCDKAVARRLHGRGIRRCTSVLESRLREVVALSGSSKAPSFISSALVSAHAFSSSSCSCSMPSGCKHLAAGLGTRPAVEGRAEPHETRRRTGGPRHGQSALAMAHLRSCSVKGAHTARSSNEAQGLGRRAAFWRGATELEEHEVAACCPLLFCERGQAYGKVAVAGSEGQSRAPT